MNTSALKLEREILTQVVQRALGSTSLELCDWEVQTVGGGMETSSSLYRLAGVAFDRGASEKWSLILKVVRPEPGASSPEGFRYWRRELLAYESGFLYSLPAPLSAPKVYETCEQEDGSIWLWMEDIPLETGFSWDMEQLGRAAFGLGVFNGAFLAQEKLPAEAWFARSWLSRYLENAEPTVAFITRHPEHPDVKAVFPGLSLPLAVTLFRERQRFLHTLENLPQTFCHQDAFHRNLLPRGEQWVGIDWGYAGLAPVGSELAPLVAMGLGLGIVPVNQAHELDRVCFENYIRGLKQAGWEPNPHQVRLGFTATLFMRYPMGAFLGEALAYLHDQSRFNSLIAAENMGKKSPEHDSDITSFYTQVTLEAMRMLGIPHVLHIVLQVLRCSLELKFRFK